MPSQDLANEIGVGTPRIVLFFLLALGFIIIFAASFNYMNLSLARSVKRAKEIGIRKVIGARKKDVVFQFLGEALLLSFLSFLLALVLLEFLIPAFYGLHPFVEDVFYLTKSPTVYLLFFGFSVLVGLISGIFPALNISSFQPIQAIKKLSNVKVFSKVGIRKALITVQFSLSLIFILVVIIVLQQQKYVLNADLGLNIDNMLNISMEDVVDYEVFAQQVGQLKGVEGISASRDPILLGGTRGTKITFHEETDSFMLVYNQVSQNYIDNWDIELLTGVNFPQENNSMGEQFIILNETATQRMGYQQPEEALGQIIKIDTIDLKVIGVARDFHHDNIWFGEIYPFGLRQGGAWASNANIRIAPTDASTTMTGIREIWNRLSPNKSMRAYYTDERAYHMQKFFQMGSKIIGFVGLLTILISCLGLLGMVIYTIEGRLKEIGVRKVLGASNGNINWQLSKGFFKLMSIAIVVAVPLTVFIGNLWLQNFVLRVSISVWMVMIGIGILLLLAMGTVLTQTFSASRTNPVNILRSE